MTVPEQVGGAVEHVLDRLDKVKRTGDGWVARCPAHEDRNPSLSIGEGSDGRVLLNCHAGCSLDAILRALHLDERSLFPPREERCIVATYSYADEDGTALFEVVRFEPKDFRQRRPDGTWGLGNTRRVLYRLPEVRAAITNGDTIYVVEGEKDVHSIEAVGATATTNPMGAGKWRPEYAQQLAGATRVVIVADADDPGVEHAQQVAHSLNGHVHSVTLVQPAAGKDVTDHLRAGRTLEQLIPRIPPAATGGWARIDLSDPEYAIPPKPPAILGLLYDEKRHVISGSPESAKTLIAYLAVLAALRQGRQVAILDFEMGPQSARRLLDDLGATLNELRAIYYVNPDEPPNDEYQAILEHGAKLVLIDAAAGAYDATGLDDNARKDAEQFARQWILPLWKAGVATLLVDHVTKDAAARGKFTIGSERKVGQADVHISCDALKPLSRGGVGLVKITVHKDRPGFLQRPTAAVFELHSHPDTHAITWISRDPHPTDENTGEFRPTVLMEKVSRFLAEQHSPVPRSTVEDSVKGKASALRQALDILTREGYITETAGAHSARLVHHERPYTQASNTSSSHLVPTSSRTRDEVPRPLVPPSTEGDEDEDEVTRDEPNPGDEDDDPETARLLALYVDDDIRF